MSQLYEFEVDGSVIHADDDLIDGREVRASAGLSPASAYVLIRTDRGFAQSIGLEDEVRLSEVERPIFRSFASDHVNTLTVDERGWEWGSDEIAEEDIRIIGLVPEDHELILDSNRDRPIERGGSVRLDGDDVERVRSREAEPQTIKILVNARKREVETGSISFEDLIGLAFPTPPSGANVALTVSYRKGPQSRPEGSLLPGQSIELVKGMIFHVTATDKS